MASIKTGPSTTGMQVLAIPAVVLLIAFLGYSSQLLFNIAADLQPGPLTTRQTATFNLLLLNLWWNYYKACTVNPGVYLTDSRPTDLGPDRSSKPPTNDDTDERSGPGTGKEQRRKSQEQQQRWCRKCAAPKPPRAHHCRHCRRCIPKMDHHCPWTGNCVSLQTFPYFIRFLGSANVALWFLLRLCYLRFHALYELRNLPAYLGPSVLALAHLTVVTLTCGGVALALGILLSTTTKSWVLNRTMIEDWEAERHEALLSRHGVRGGAGGGSTWWATDEESDGEDGSESDGEEAADGRGDAALRIRRVEFPYDVGIWRNMCQAMGTRNILAWLWPLAGGPVVSPDGRGTGWDWEENGFNPHEGMWPPPDPEKLRRERQGGWPGRAADAAAAAMLATSRTYATVEDEKAAFKARQEWDLRRRRGWAQQKDQQASGIIAELEEDEELDVLEGHHPDNEEKDQESDDADGYSRHEQGMDGEPGWTNADGDRLGDFGVDEEAEAEEFVTGQPEHPGVDYGDVNDDDVPLGELIRKRRAKPRDPDI